MDEADNLTGLLRDWASGSDNAASELFAQVYPQLKRIASRQLANERVSHTLQPTALVNEAYLKLVRAAPTDWDSRAHFFAVSARIIRQILVDHGRRRRSQRRGGGEQPLTLQPDLHGETSGLVDLLALDSALDRLAELNAPQANIVELRYFGGLTIEKTALVTSQSEATVNRQWRAARAWLYRTLETP